MALAGVAFMVIVLVSPGDEKISHIFVQLLEDKSDANATRSITSVGKRVQDRYNLNIGVVEFDRERSISVSKRVIETELKCTMRYVSLKACFAESSIRLIKQRTRIKISACMYAMNRKVLIHIVVGA